jgi:hypothetical protein
MFLIFGMLAIKGSFVVVSVEELVGLGAYGNVGVDPNRPVSIE